MPSGAGRAARRTMQKGPGLALRRGPSQRRVLTPGFFGGINARL